MKTLLERWRHRRWRTLLSAYVDQQLSEGEQVRLQAHLQRCDSCRGDLEEMQATVALLRRMPQPALPRSFLLTQPPEPALQARGLGLRWATQAAATTAAIALAIVVMADATGVLPSDAGGLALTAGRQDRSEGLLAPEPDTSPETSLAADAASPEEAEFTDGSGAQAPTDEMRASDAPAETETSTSQYAVYLEGVLLALALLLGAAALSLWLRSRRVTS